MWNAKGFCQWLVLGCLATIVGSTQVWAGAGLLAGSHVGTILGSDEKVEFLIGPIADREGSFYGVLFQPWKKAVLYLIDPEGEGMANAYSMVPLEVARGAGLISVVNDTPSLVLAVGALSKKGRATFQVTSSQAGNQNGFQGPIVFEGLEESKYRWIDLAAGVFLPQESEDERQQVQVSMMDSDDISTLTSTLSSSITGNYQLQKARGTGTDGKGSGMYTLKMVALRATGPDVEEYPQRIGFFVYHDRTWPRSNEILFVLVNPTNDSDVMVLERKDGTDGTPWE